MFPSSVIRKLALSEEMLAETHNFVGLSAHLEGPIDLDALTDAFDLCSRRIRCSPRVWSAALTAVTTWLSTI